MAAPDFEINRPDDEENPDRHATADGWQGGRAWQGGHITDAPWATGVEIPPEEMRRIHKTWTNRVSCLLTLTLQHRVLLQDQVCTLLYPQPNRGSALRQAQIQCQHLDNLKLIVRWPNRAMAHGWRKVEMPVWVTQRGAAVLADRQHLDRAPLVTRAGRCFQFSNAFNHDTALVGLMASIARESYLRGGMGLYHWISQDTLRRILYGKKPIPDAWGRLLLPDREVTFNVEWDAKTEAPDVIATKARNYREEYKGAAEHVLFVAPDPKREQSIRRSLRDGGGDSPRLRFYTTSVPLLLEHGAMADVWLPMDRRDRASLTTLPFAVERDPETRPLRASVGYPGWWNERPLAGEGD